MLSEARGRELLIEYALKMHREQLTAAKTGNISLRIDGGLLITPTGVAYEKLQLANLVFMTLDGDVRDNELLPSSEWHFHCDIYKARPDVNAVVHAHSKAATALACLSEPIPAFHYMVALFGGEGVPCAPYETFGTEALSKAVVSTLAGHYQACLMQNHGMLTVDQNLPQAYQRAIELEALAEQYLLAKSVGVVSLLSSQQMAEARDAFSQYGQKK